MEARTKARAQYPEIDAVIVNKIKTKEIAKAVEVRDFLPAICISPKVLSKFVQESVTFEKAYASAVSSGEENVNLYQIKKFRDLICRPETESQPVRALGMQQGIAYGSTEAIRDHRQHQQRHGENRTCVVGRCAFAPSLDGCTSSVRESPAEFTCNLISVGFERQG